MDYNEARTTKVDRVKTMLPRIPLIKTFFKALFTGKDVYFKGKKFPLRKIDGLKRFDVGNLLLIEQNPKKETEWAARARKGARIMWIIDTKFNRYLVRVEDGKITNLRGPSNGEK